VTSNGNPGPPIDTDIRGWGTAGRFSSGSAGTRITVELILEKLAAGETVEQILAAHPRLTEAGVRAAIGFAAEVLSAEVVYPMDYVPA